MMENSQKTQVPPPSYQEGQQAPGQTYYQPPTVPEGGYAPPPPVNNHMGGHGMQQKFTQFYAPPQNHSLGIKRRFCSVICCCILIGLIVGLAAGLTSSANDYSSSSGCNCASNADCTSIYGSGTYCYNGCQCARY